MGCCGDHGCCDDGEHKEKEKCCGKALRVWIIGANCITIAVAIAEIAMGVYVMIEPGWNFVGGPLGGYVIIMGILLAFVSGFGIFAGCKGARADCVMYIYATSISILFLGQVVGLALAASNTSQVADQVNTRWTESLSLTNREFIGLQFGCCAASDPTVINGGETDATIIADYGDCSHKAETTRFKNLSGENITCDVYPLCADEACASYIFPTNESPECNAANWATTKQDCATYTSAPMPSCQSTDVVATNWWVANAGIQVESDMLTPVANCFGKLQEFVSSNWMATVIACIVYLLWQILLAVFAWLLACDCGSYQGCHKAGIPMEPQYKEQHW